MATRYVRAEDTFISPDGSPKKEVGKPAAAAAQKKMFILAGAGALVLLIIIGIAVAVALSRGGNGGASGSNTPAPSALPTVGASDPTPTLTPTITPTSVPTPTKEPGRIPISGVAVYDFNEFAQGVMPNGDVLIVRTDEYQIVYAKASSSFSIAILVENFLSARETAEEQFITLLGISDEAACKLTVTVGSPSFINSRYAGLSFPLSHCN